MKTRIGLGLLTVTLALGLGLPPALHGATALGDTYEQVIAQKGKPGGKMEAGDTMILRYPDELIRLKAGKVVSVDAVKNRDTTPPKVATAPPPPPPARPEPTPAKPEPAGPVGKISWTTDYRTALTEARAQNRRVFMFFTGSDWCGWCMRLQKEILTTPEFARYASQNLILLEIDFPQSKRQSDQLKTQNQMLASRFQIQGYPTVIVLDPNARKVGQLGYQEGGPNPFVQQLKSL